MTFFVQIGKTSSKVNLPLNSTVKDLKLEYSKIVKLPKNRLTFKLGETRLDDETKTLEQYGVLENSSISAKDIGPQIGYRTVFLGKLSHCFN